MSAQEASGAIAVLLSCVGAIAATIVIVLILGSRSTRYVTARPVVEDNGEFDD
jgi:hypothetical protein